MYLILKCESFLNSDKTKKSNSLLKRPKRHLVLLLTMQHLKYSMNPKDIICHAIFGRLELLCTFYCVAIRHFIQRLVLRSHRE